MNEIATRFYPEIAFGGFTDVDGTIVFYGRVNALLKPSFTVIDFGCGRAEYMEDPVPYRRDLRNLHHKVAHVIGMDVAEEAAMNPAIDEFRRLVPGSPWPVESHSANLIVCDWVMEHLHDPAGFFAEARRVLVAGGYLCVRTANARSYVGIASRLVPNRMHHRVLAKVQDNRRPEDVFPTVYRCNTVGSMRKHLREAGFHRSIAYGYEAEPSYLSFSSVAYGAGALYQRLAPRFLRSAIFAFAQS